MAPAKKEARRRKEDPMRATDGDSACVNEKTRDEGRNKNYMSMSNVRVRGEVK